MLKFDRKNHKMDLILKLAKLGEQIHDGNTTPEGIEEFLSLSEERLKELYKQVAEFYQSGTLEDWKAYYFARLCLQSISRRRSGSRS